MIRERKKGEKFFRFEFTEGGKRISGTFNGKKGLPFVATKQEARDHEAQIRIHIRTQLREGTYGKEGGLEDFGGFFDKVFLPYAKDCGRASSVGSKLNTSICRATPYSLLSTGRELRNLTSFHKE